MKPINGFAQDLEFTETIERAALIAWYRAASNLDLPDCDWRLEEVGDALCSVCGSDPSILINRVLGLGMHSQPTAEQLEEIKRIYHDAGVSHFFLHVIPPVLGAETVQLLTDCGYRRHRGWMKFKRGTTETGTADTALEIRRIGKDDAAKFADIVVSAFDLSDASRPVIAALANDPDWHLYMSFDGSRAAGTGAVYIKGNIAYFDWGATHEDFRRRGSQTAMLNARISDAREAGCSSITTMTGEEVPGEPQHSYNNLLRTGFEEAYLRENWIPASD
ncbi:MAG: GNAT family N-acetyltransferase [Woeseiaceae bacterium]|nr:GNAT family N-acetyltransferase [Woeseiaceae bacterium]